MEEHKKEIDPADLPQNEVFKRKEIHQYPQTADTGKPLNTPEEKDDSTITGQEKERNKTSSEDGLNERHPEGDGSDYETLQKQGVDI
jgi:hypothetical protein